MSEHFVAPRLPRVIEDQLATVRATGWFWNPVRTLRRARTLDAGEPGGLAAWVGERHDGSLELVRRGAGEAGLELLLNERQVASEVEHAGLVRPLWAAREAFNSLVVGFSWRAGLELEFPLDLRWLLRAFTTVSRTVAALHAKGWVHADLKPEAVVWAQAPEQALLWDLRLAQRPGPRRFDAFSARFAAPEQVTGGELDPRTDVYALGVMLYSLFIRGRFPSIVAPSGGTLGGKAGAASLSPITCLGGPPSDTNGVSRPAPAGDAQATLGAKVLFATELERVIRRTTDIAVASELLRLIERATSHEPRERFADAAALATAIAELLSLAEESAAPSGAPDMGSGKT